MLEYTSKVNYANPKTNSLKAGIPKEIVKVLGLKPQDNIKWSVDVEDNEIKVIVSKE